jgi:hypothetical protein
MSRLFTRTVQVVAVTVVTALAVVGFVNLVSGGSATGIVTASSGAVQVCPATGCTATSCHATSGLGGGRQRVGGRQGGGEDFVDGESFDD